MHVSALLHVYFHKMFSILDITVQFHCCTLRALFSFLQTFFVFLNCSSNKDQIFLWRTDDILWNNLSDIWFPPPPDKIWADQIFRDRPFSDLIH